MIFARTSLGHIGSRYLRLVAVQAKINTVLAGVSWNQIERQEGKFDFSVLDGVIQGARSHNLRLVLLWFASWKNSTSSYPPDWVKKDFDRFPRARTKAGRTVELLTPLSDANRDADARAFAALMRHVREVDGREHTVIMIQVENEVGMEGDSRDRSAAADKAFAGPVPRELMDYLPQRKEYPDPRVSQGVGSGGLQDLRDLGRGVRAGRRDGGDLHGLALCALPGPRGRGGQSRIPAPDVRERGVV